MQTRAIPDIWQRRNRERIESLVPALRPLAVDLLSSARDLGWRVVVVCGYRSPAEQAALYAQGRDPVTGRVVDAAHVVTRARPEDAPHCRGAALDVAFLRADDSLSWDEGHPWAEIGRLGESLGLVWGGRWRRFRDRPHFELPDWRSLPMP